MKTRKIKFIAKGFKWFDKVNGNTYHSVRVERVKDGAVLACQWQYGYGDQYQQTARVAMLKAGWLPKRYNDSNVICYDRENNYPIEWFCQDGLKRDMVYNGQAHHEKELQF